MRPQLKDTNMPIQEESRYDTPLYYALEDKFSICSGHEQARSLRTSHLSGQGCTSSLLLF